MGPPGGGSSGSLWKSQAGKRHVHIYIVREISVAAPRRGSGEPGHLGKRQSCRRRATALAGGERVSGLSARARAGDLTSVLQETRCEGRGLPGRWPRCRCRRAIPLETGPTLSGGARRSLADGRWGAARWKQHSLETLAGPEKSVRSRRRPVKAKGTALSGDPGRAGVAGGPVMSGAGSWAAAAVSADASEGLTRLRPGMPRARSAVRSALTPAATAFACKRQALSQRLPFLTSTHRVTPYRVARRARQPHTEV